MFDEADKHALLLSLGAGLATSVGGRAPRASRRGCHCLLMLYQGTRARPYEYTLAAPSSLAWPLVPASAQPDCSFMVYTSVPHTLAASSSLAWPLVPFSAHPDCSRSSKTAVKLE